LTHKEAIQIIETARQFKTRSQIKSNIIALCMQFQYYCGLRISEAIQITPNDIREDNKRIEIIVNGKGDKQRVVPIVQADFISTIKYLNHDGIKLNEPYINKSRKTMWRWYKKTTKITGIYINTHMFRHSYARNLLLKGVPINTVSVLLGHQYLSTTIDSYLQLTPDSKALKNAWDLLEGDLHGSI